MTKVASSKESSEQFSNTNEGSDSASSAVAQVSGTGGPLGKYRAKATAGNWNGGSATLVTFPGNVTIASFSAGNDGHVDCGLAAGSYLWAYSGKPQGVQTSIRAI